MLPVVFICICNCRHEVVVVIADTKSLSLLQTWSCCPYRQELAIIIADMELLSLLQERSCFHYYKQEVVVVVADMKLLLVCLVLLGCTVSHVSTSEQIQLMKRLLRVLENERDEIINYSIENDSEYSNSKESKYC